MVRKNFFPPRRSQFLADTKMCIKNWNNSHWVIFAQTFHNYRQKPKALLNAKHKWLYALWTTPSIENCSERTKRRLCVSFLFVVFVWWVFFFPKKATFLIKKWIYIFPRPQFWKETGVWLKVMWSENVQFDNAILMSVLRV